MTSIAEAPVIPTFETEEEKTDWWLAEANRRDALAKRTPCAYNALGCDGDWHEGGEDPDHWMHRLAIEKFDCFRAEVFAQNSRCPKFFCDILTDVDTEMSADDLRKDAEAYASFPAWLKSIADRLDHLNAEVK